MQLFTDVLNFRNGEETEDGARVASYQWFHLLILIVLACLFSFSNYTGLSMVMTGQLLNLK